MTRKVYIVDILNIPTPFALQNPQFLNRTNSFQAIVITDGVFSYALFIYECCSMEWSGLYDYRVTIGFNSDGIHYDNHPLSRADDAAAVACLGLPDSGWTNIIYELTYGMPQPTKPHEEGGIFLHLCMDVTKVFRLICQQGMNNSDITVAVVSTMEPHDEGGIIRHNMCADATKMFRCN